MKKNRCFWIAGILALLLAFFARGQMVFLLCAIWVCGMPFVTLAINRRIVSRVRIEIRTDGWASKNETFCGKIYIKNDSGWGLPHMEMKLDIKNLLTGSVQTRRLTETLLPGGEHEISFSSESSACGCLSSEISEMSAFSIWKLWAVSRKMDVRSETVIWPELFEPRIDMEGGYAQDMESVEYAPDRPGNDPAERFDIREYQPGDRLNSIHWKLSGKLDRWMIQRPGFPLENSIVLFFQNSGQESEKQVDASMEVFASVSRSLIRQQKAHRLVWADQNGNLQWCRADNEDDFTGILSGALAAGKSERLVDVYRRTSGEGDAAHMVCVCTGPGEIPENVSSETTRMHLLVCTGEEAEPMGQAGMRLYQTGFTPDGYEQELADLII